MGEKTIGVEFDKGDPVEFVVPDRYQVDPSEPGLGQGGFGAVCGAVSAKDGSRVAIKRNFRVFSSRAYKATVREVMLLAHFTSAGKMPHPNVISLIDVFVPAGASMTDMDDIYFVMPAYDCSLRTVLGEEALAAQLNLPRRASLMRQLLRGLQAIHSAGCIHRDIKPENVLVRGVNEKTGELSERLELAICDLGSGRDVQAMVTQDVLVTTWPYVAPEAMVESPQNPWAVAKDAKTEKRNPRALDMWAAACILGEMLSAEQIFPEARFGPRNGLQKMCQVLGAMPEWLLDKIKDASLRDSLAKLGSGRSLEKHLEDNGLFQCEDNPDGATPAEGALLARMLVYDPEERISVDVALGDKYFAGEEDTPVPDIPEFKSVDSTDSDLTPDAARQLMWDIIQRFRS
eukprot:TRINITY_DN64925_c0_g1_i1.p1 TRINITY_DN64925_c0_g1~~TRINITY_DN64925_c0_g1_i1.p1  ORF type:complete len:433 (+),score=117.88 TRINITY_DN64925_c0_g1_i1:94-1299(+)